MDYKSIILDELAVLKQRELKDGNTFKAIAYGKVISQLKHIPAITSMEDLKEVKGIGKSIQQKIEEIFKTGILEEAEIARQDPTIHITEDLMNVYGIGRVKANELVKKNGILSISQLRDQVNLDPTLLNDNQKIGLQFYEHFLERIPRAEMKKHETKLLTFLKEVDPSIEGVIVGSYRRGEKNSGDIDMLIKSANKEVLSKFVKILIDKKYVTHTLAHGDKKFMGVCQTSKKGKSRRLDLLLTPPEEYAFALLYFTGSDKFNVQMRKHALTKGYSLNEHGFTPKSPLMETEEEIFQFIDYPYVSPKHRKNS